jgi:hypothetical protein
MHKERAMKKLKIAGAAVAGLFVLITAVGFVLPRKCHCESSIVVDATPEAIYPLIANFKDGWAQWTPFKYEQTPITYEGPLEGVGAVQRWAGPESGDGSLKIVRADPARGVEMELAMMQESYKATGSLLCEPAGPGKTKVTWVDDFDMGSSPYRRWFGLALPTMIGKEFDTGLASLKAKAEAKPQTAAQ